MSLEWNVYYEDINAKAIKPFNVFQHHGFREDVEEAMKKSLTYEKFSHEIKRSAQYYFWSKSEYEVVITSWPPYINHDEYNRITEEMAKRDYTQTHRPLNIRPVVGEKIDIFDQLMLNWSRFIDYLWGKSSLVDFS